MAAQAFFNQLFSHFPYRFNEQTNSILLIPFFGRFDKFLGG
jgi:hypothetical protein